MCRNIRPLFNFDPPATEAEIHDAALQFVRKVSGCAKPSKANERAFDDSVDAIGQTVRDLLNALVTDATPRNRETEAARRRARGAARLTRS